jgi:metacaspase-1
MHPLLIVFLQTLIHILGTYLSSLSLNPRLTTLSESEPHPTFKNLMLTLSHRLHDAAMQMHNQTKRYKVRLKEWKRKEVAKGRRPSEVDRSVPEVVREMDNFQDPQLSSRRPLVSDVFR